MSFSCGEDTPCITLEVDGAMLVATLVISPDEGNAAQCTANGLYVPGGVVSGDLPADPVDGQEVIYLASEIAGVLWPFRYRDGATSEYKWEAKGPTPLMDEVVSLQGLTGAAPGSYVNIGGGTNGPDITVPFAGDYDAQLDVMMDGAAVGTATSAAIKVGATAADFDDSVANYENNYVSVSRRVRLLAVPAGAQLLVQYKKADAASAGFGHRVLWVWPVRVKTT